jgi:hypothetical protein
MFLSVEYSPVHFIKNMLKIDANGYKRREQSCFIGQAGWGAHRSQMEIHISDRTYKFQNKTGLDDKANSELLKSNQSG